MKKQGKQNPFRNQKRIDALHDAIINGDRSLLESIVEDRAVNSQISRKLKGKTTTWEEVVEDMVYRVDEVGSGEKCAIKLFDDLPFHELCGNVLATKLMDSVGPFFVRCYDVGRFTDTAASFFILLEYVAEDTESIDLNEPIHMYNLFYQVAYASHHLSTACQLQHFDMRFDNIRVKILPQNKDLFNNGVKTSFVVKIGDWGQCEFGFGEESNRPLNTEIPREEEYAPKWGVYPREYSNYDFQYFMSTLTPVLDNLHGLNFYYIYNMVMQYLEPVSFTSAQDRPIIITARTPLEIVGFLKKAVLPSVGLLSEDDDKENAR
jgi:hypothetical protein